MRARTCLLLGIACLVLAQVLSSTVLVHMRGALVANSDVFGALKPGEFAGTLMLGGLRGAACDLLWMRAQRAKDAGSYYESLALATTISKIQPRFEPIWQFLAWDVAYNIGAETEGEDGKWAWYLQGLDIEVRGIQRNPEGERLIRYLATMFDQKGEDFHARIEATNWAVLLNPVFRQVNAQVAPQHRIPLLPAQAGQTNCRIAELCYRADILASEANHLRVLPFVRRMVPISIENDGNCLRNHGDHLAALRRYLEALDEWQKALAWSRLPPSGPDSPLDHEISLEIAQHNEGRLLRKTELLAYQLTTDPTLSARFQTELKARHFDAALHLVAVGDSTPGTSAPGTSPSPGDALGTKERISGWREAVPNGHFRWLDEP